MANQYWWQTAQGIKDNFAKEREWTDADYKQRIHRLNAQERDMLDALEQHPIPKGEWAMKYQVRIDVRFDLEVEADDEDEAVQIAQDEFDPASDPFEITESLAFEKGE